MSLKFLSKLFSRLPGLALLVLPALTGCGSDDGVDGQVMMTRYDIVTFVENGDDGLAWFELVGQDDMGSIDLYARAAVDTAVAKPGQRMIIAYTRPDSLSDGLIGLRGVGAVTNVPLRAARASVIDAIDGDPVYLLALWRTGTFINIRARLSYSLEPRSWGLVVDSATIDDAVPRLRLVHRLAPGVSADSTWMRAVYTSVDIGPLWRRPGVDGVTVSLDNSNNPLFNTITFNKQ